jgi:hypothetical protein
LACNNVAAPFTDGERAKQALILVLSLEGHVLKDWRGGGTAAEIGSAVRQKLGNPAYSQIGQTK